MDFKNKQQEKVKEQLLKFELPSELVDKIVLHADDNWIEQLIVKLDKAQNEKEALSKTLELFMLRNFSKPTYISKKDITKKFPITKRRFEELIRAKLIPFIEVSKKNRIFSIDDIYDHLEKYKVDSIVYSVDPISLRNAIIQLKR